LKFGAVVVVVLALAVVQWVFQAVLEPMPENKSKPQHQADLQDAYTP
jgi:hypothetical protein